MFLFKLTKIIKVNRSKIMVVYILSVIFIDVCPQRPSAGHVGASVSVLHAGQVSERTSCQDNEGQPPGGSPAAGLRAAAQREVPDLPQHGQVNKQTNKQVRGSGDSKSDRFHVSSQVWQDPGGLGQFGRYKGSGSGETGSFAQLDTNEFPLPRQSSSLTPTPTTPS